jgi:subtilisin family serine protease
MLMLLTRRTLGGLLAALLLPAGLLTGPGPVAQAATGARPVAAAKLSAAARPEQTMTLLTGDRVTLRPDGSFAIEPGKGRAHITFSTSRSGGHLRVIPSDAMAAVAQRRLDRRLFDVTALLAYGYDTRGIGLPLLMTAPGKGAARTRSAAAAVPAGGRVTGRLASLGAVAMTQDRRQATTFWQGLVGTPGEPHALPAAIGTIWLDALRRPALDESVPQIGAPTAWQAGLSGQGVTVAVLDTGIDDTHPDLAGRVAARSNFTGGAEEGGEDDRDLYGHGTHVASILAGSGAASGGRYRGVAPDVRLLDGKVCAEWGCPESWILAGMQWAAADQHAKVVNMSLSGWGSQEIDPTEEAVGTLTAQYGTLFVVAAGNDGPYATTVGTPGSADAALTVGAVTKTDEIAEFSSRGPLPGGGGLKPDITAPGVDITAAISQPVTAEPASVSFGTQLWPHADDEVLTRTVTYSNSSSEPVTLDLAVTATLAGSAVPAGMLTVSSAQLTVPAGGSASATVTADTRLDVPDGYLTGVLTATSGSRAVRTPVVLNKEVESYDVTLNHLDGTGQPVQFVTDVFPHDGTAGTNLGGVGTITVRLPVGRYVLSSWVFARYERTMSLLVYPALTVTASRTVTLDARLAKTSTITVPRPSTVLAFADIAFTLQTPAGPISSGQGGYSWTAFLTADVGDGTPVEGFTSFISAVFAKEGTDADGYFHDSPWTYTIGHHEATSRLISGYQRTIADSELATLQTSLAGGDAMYADWYAASSSLPDFADATLGFYVTYRMPSTAIHYVNVEPGTRWRGHLDRRWTDPATGDFWSYPSVVSPWTAYQAGQAYGERWNNAVFGPVFPGPGDHDWNKGVTRTGDVITVDMPLYGDGAGRVDREEGLGTTVLYRDGTQIGKSTAAGQGSFPVPAGDAQYRLEVDAQRGTPFALSTKTRVVWTFRSGHVETAALPLSAVRFAPALDLFNTAPSSRAFTVPVTVTTQPGSSAGQLTGLTVDVSYDDGGTWTKATVQDGVVTVCHPEGTGYVSLRAMAVDSDGNRVEQTILRAYRYSE